MLIHEILEFLFRHHKTLLIDCDFKRGDQHRDLGAEKINKLNFINLSKENINKLKISENFYLIPKISQLNSSFQFLYSSEFSQKLDFLKEEFDYIVIDTAPVLSVSDTSILLKESDVNLAVIRHGLTKINEVKQLLSIFEQMGKDI